MISLTRSARTLVSSQLLGKTGRLLRSSRGSKLQPAEFCGISCNFVNSLEFWYIFPSRGLRSAKPNLQRLSAIHPISSLHYSVILKLHPEYWLHDGMTKFQLLSETEQIPGTGILWAWSLTIEGAPKTKCYAYDDLDPGYSIEPNAEVPVYGATITDDAPIVTHDAFTRKEMLSSVGKEVWIDWVRIDCLLSTECARILMPLLTNVHYRQHSPLFPLCPLLAQEWSPRLRWNENKGNPFVAHSEMKTRPSVPSPRSLPPRFHSTTLRSLNTRPRCLDALPAKHEHNQYITLLWRYLANLILRYLRIVKG